MKVTKKMRQRAPKLAAYWAKKNRKAKHGAAKPKRKKKTNKPHHHTEGHVAKSKKKKKTGGKRRGGGGARRSSHRRHHHGGISGGGWKSDLVFAGGGLAFGVVEKKMKEDANFFLNKLPTPISAIGRTGNATLALYLASYLLPGQWKRYARTGAKVGAAITMYQLGRKGEAFKEGADFFAISGPGDGEERFIGDDDLGDVAGEFDELSGHHVRGDFDVVVDDEHDFHDHHEDPSGASTPGVLAPVSPG